MHARLAPAARASNLQSLPQKTYRFRVLGMGLACLPLIAVMMETRAGWASWAWMVSSCLLWPHLAYALARRSKDPLRAELRNFMIDSMIAGSWVPLLHFNALPSIVLLTVVTADKVNSGVAAETSCSSLGLALTSISVIRVVFRLARRDPQAPRRHHPRGAFGRQRLLTDGDDAAIAHRDIGDPRRRSRSIEYRAALDQQVADLHQGRAWGQCRDSESTFSQLALGSKPATIPLPVAPSVKAPIPCRIM